MEKRWLKLWNTITCNSNEFYKQLLFYSHNPPHVNPLFHNEKTQSKNSFCKVHKCMNCFFTHKPPHPEDATANIFKFSFSNVGTSEIYIMHKFNDYTSSLHKFRKTLNFREILRPILRPLILVITYDYCIYK